MNFWNQIFKSDNKSGPADRLSSQQCRAAEVVLGEAPAECVDYPMLGKQLYKEVEKQLGLNEILENMKIVIDGMKEEIMKLDEDFRRMESEQIQEQQEKLFFTPRATKAMFGTDWITGESTTRKTRKEDPNSWTDAMAGFTKKVHEVQTKNFYSRHDLKNRLPGQYGIK